MRGNGRLIVAVLVCVSPILFVWSASGKEGLIVLLLFFGSVVVGFVLLLVAHWSVETVLVSIGFNKRSVNRDASKTTYIFWGN